MTAEGWTETYRGGVSAWECDAFGHLNIAFYVERFGDAASDLVERLVPSVRLRTEAIDTGYLKELRSRDGIVVATGVIAVDDRGVSLAHEARNDDGAMTTRVRHRLVPSERDGWSDVAAVLRQTVLVTPAHAFDPLPVVDGPCAVPTGRDRVKATELDEGGRLSLWGYVDRFSTASLQLGQAMGMTGAYLRDFGRGFSTFETRLQLLDEAPRAGVGVVVASRLLAVGQSSIRMLHEMRGTADGRLLARFYQSGVHFDLETRRSAPLPAALRERARELGA